MPEKISPPRLFTSGARFSHVTWGGGQRLPKSLTRRFTAQEMLCDTQKLSCPVWQPVSGRAARARCYCQGWRARHCRNCAVINMIKESLVFEGSS